MRRTASATLIMLLLFTLPAHAQQGDAPLLERVKQAYRETRQYAADVHFAIEQQRGRWHTLQDTTMPLALDRAERRLLVDRPDMRVLVSDNSLKLESESLPGRYLDAPLGEPTDRAGAAPITYQQLVERVPYLNDPPFPGLAFLLEEDPVAALTGGSGQVETLPPAEGDGEARPRLRFETRGRVITLTIDPQTHLIAHALIEVDPDLLAAQGAGTDYARWSFGHRVTAHNQPLPAETFAFEPGDRVAAATLEELVAAGDGGQRSMLEGKPAPALQTQTLEGEPFDLAQAGRKVVVLDFWATWCGPCEGGLAEMQKVHEWAQREGKDVAIYAVNLAERPDQITAYWEQRGLTMPVLMDPQGEIAGAWGVQGIPASFVVVDGVVRKAHVGFAPGQGERLRAEVEAFLAEPGPDAAAEAR